MKPPERILFIAEGQLGDILVFTPVLRAVKKSLPGVKISVLLFLRRKYFESDSEEHARIHKSNFIGTSEVLRDNPYVDEVFEINRSALKNLKGFRRLKAELVNVKFLRKLKFDTIICNFPQDRFAWLSYLAGAKTRIGEKSGGFPWLLTEKLNIRQEKDGVINYLLELVKPIGVKADSLETEFHIKPADLVKAKDYLIQNSFDPGNIIGVHPGTSQGDRRWLPERFAEVIDCIVNEKKLKVILLSSSYDHNFVGEIQQHLKSKVLEVNTGSISELAAYEKYCRFVIAHSSGPLHLAAAIGTPTIGIYQKKDDIRWGRLYDENLHQVVKPENPCKVCPPDKCLGIIPENNINSSVCMRDINVKDVLEKVNFFLK